MYIGKKKKKRKLSGSLPNVNEGHEDFARARVCVCVSRKKLAAVINLCKLERTKLFYKIRPTRTVDITSR